MNDDTVDDNSKQKVFTEVLKTKADGEGGLGQSGELARSSEVVPGQRPGPTAHGVAPLQLS